jgi:uncharacterized membrane protein YhdT
MTAIFRWRVALVVAIAFVACLLISRATKDTKGLEGAVSWVTFTGMWLAIPVLIIIIIGTTIRTLRRTTERRV